jgi:ParB/RepB/Spo0J family partition protein
MATTIPQRYETVRLSDLRRHPDNPREGDVGAIHESIVTNGFFGALVVQRSTGRILAGNHRWEAARAAGLTELPAIVVDVDDDAAARILLVDNRTNDLASYDDAALAAMLTSMDDLAGTGYTLDDVESLRRKAVDPLTLAPADDDGGGEYQCPNCDYQWRGKPRPGKGT